MSLSLSADLLAARYRLERRLAAGGMGEVWRGVDLVLGRPVAVKLLQAGYAQHEDTLARFRAEARHAAALSHPAIAQVYDYGDAADGQPPFLVMELVNGYPLTQLLKSGPLGPVRTLDVVAQVGAGLAAAHAANLVHRDIKPGNLLVGLDGAVKITDFGIAYAAGSAPLTRTGALIGTPAYLAPERLTGAAAGPASDLYSLGIVAYECLTGAVPFAGTSMEVALAHQHQPLPPLPQDVPSDVAALVGDLTAREPARRPAGAALVAARAAQLRADLTTAAGWHSEPLPVPAAGTADAGSPTLRAEEWLPNHAEIPGAMLGLDPDDTGRSGPHWAPPRPRPARHRLLGRAGAVLAAVAIAVAAGLAGWQIAIGYGASSQPSPTRPPASNAAAGRFVQVNGAALVGQPARAVAWRLRQLGLRVSLSWAPGGDAARGTVLRVFPSGKVRVGTSVTVMAAQLRGHDHGHGNGGGNGHQGGN